MAEQPHKVRRGPLHMIAARFRLNLRCHPVDGAFRPLIDPRVSFRIPQVIGVQVSGKRMLYSALTHTPFCLSR